MSKKIKFIRASLLSASALICASLVSPALAQDNDEDFSGIYGGAEVGFLGIDTNVSGIDNVNGVYYGGFLGARGQNDSGFVYGVEGYFGGSSNNLTLSGGGLTANLGTGRIFGVDGIVGYVASDKVLIFAHGGYVNAKLNLTANTTPPLAISDTEGGWRAGGGVEIKIKNNVNGRVKLSYGKFSDSDLNFFSALAGILFNF
jgi:outer membrane immunogenic protein